MDSGYRKCPSRREQARDRVQKPKDDHLRSTHRDIRPHRSRLEKEATGYFHNLLHLRIPVSTLSTIRSAKKTVSMAHRRLQRHNLYQYEGIRWHQVVARVKEPAPKVKHLHLGLRSRSLHMIGKRPRQVCHLYSLTREVNCRVQTVGRLLILRQGEPASRHLLPDPPVGRQQRNQSSTKTSLHPEHHHLHHPLHYTAIMSRSAPCKVMSSTKMPQSRRVYGAPVFRSTVSMHRSPWKKRWRASCEAIQRGVSRCQHQYYAKCQTPSSMAEASVIEVCIPLESRHPRMDHLRSAHP